MEDNGIKELYFDEIYNFSDYNSYEKLKRKEICQENAPMFSFLMCVYNETSLLNSAISSLINQSFEQWELIILDNSDDKTERAWKMICNAMQRDARIVGIRSNKNVGWAKGAALCLKKVKGLYISFLAADDCICKGALYKLATHIHKNFPDILWVGNGEVLYDGKWRN